MAKLSQLYPTVIISGRSRKDLLPRVAGLGLRGVVGNHGAELGREKPVLPPDLRGWRQDLEEHLAIFDGIVIEDKAYSIAVHYRKAKQTEQTGATILRVAASLAGARVVSGKQVVNIVPANARHKGSALDHERVRLGCETAIYIGDDETDEDVFSSTDEARTLTIRVGDSAASRALYCLSGQTHVDRLLRSLVRLRQTPLRGK